MSAPEELAGDGRRGDVSRTAWSSTRAGDGFADPTVYGREGVRGEHAGEDQVVGEYEETSAEEEEEEEDCGWIKWFCSLRGCEFFCEVDDAYIRDDFNLTGLSAMVPYYDYALDTILDMELPGEDSLTEEQEEMIEASAELLYGLIHARYIITSRGLSQMCAKFQDGDFGRCPRVYCQGQPMLPLGQSDLPRVSTVDLFCPSCRDIYYPKASRHEDLDGAYFGTTFAHLFLMTYPSLIPAVPRHSYVPRVFGFKIHNSSEYWNPKGRRKGSPPASAAGAHAPSAAAAASGGPSPSARRKRTGRADEQPAQ